jgi:polysaccharide pyruvyl transferase WcaK-like protein
MKLLILNSDSPNNRGDRAILAGNIILLKKHFPDAEIWALSEYPERDASWFGINFFNMKVYTVNIFKIITLLFFSKSCDYIFWGGGEILKDYTNKIGVYYWVVKILLVRLFNKKIIGMFQGIGPTKSKLNQKLIAFIVNRTKVFLVRDGKSKEKLINWGVRIKVISSFDPAVLAKPPVKSLDSTHDSLATNFDIDINYLDNCIGTGTRKWFHYKKSSFLPFKIANKLTFNNSTRETEEQKSLYKSLASIYDSTIEKYSVNLLFFPMHMSMSENDTESAERIISYMKYKNKVRVLSKDILSPEEYLYIISKCKIFIGLRLHSSILSAIAGVPTIIFYYIEKGRLFFHQIGMERYSFPIDNLLDKTFIKRVNYKIDNLFEKRTDITRLLRESITEMSTKIEKDFNLAMRIYIGTGNILINKT